VLWPLWMYLVFQAFSILGSFYASALARQTQSPRMVSEATEVVLAVAYPEANAVIQQRDQIKIDLTPLVVTLCGEEYLKRLIG